MSDSFIHDDGTTEPATDGESGPQERFVHLVSPVTPTIEKLQNAWRWINPRSQYYWALRIEGVDLETIADRYDLTANQRYYRWHKKGRPNYLVLLAGPDVPVQLLMARARNRSHLNDEEAHLEECGAHVHVTDLRCSPVEFGRWELSAPPPKQTAYVRPRGAEIERVRQQILSVDGPPDDAKEKLERILAKAKWDWYWVAHVGALRGLEKQAHTHLARIRAQHGSMTVAAEKKRVHLIRPSRWPAGRLSRIQYVVNVGRSGDEASSTHRKRRSSSRRGDGPPGGRKRARSRYVRGRTHLDWSGRHEDAVDAMPTGNRKLRELLMELGVPREKGEATGARATIQKIQNRPHKTAKILARHRRRHGAARMKRLMAAIDRYADRIARGDASGGRVSTSVENDVDGCPDAA